LVFGHYVIEYGAHSLIIEMLTLEKTGLYITIIFTIIYNDIFVRFNFDSLYLK